MSPESPRPERRKKSSEKMSPMVLRLVAIQEKEPGLIDVVNFLGSKYTRPEITEMHSNSSSILHHDALAACTRAGKFHGAEERASLFSNALDYLIQARGL